MSGEYVELTAADLAHRWRERTLLESVDEAVAQAGEAEEYATPDSALRWLLRLAWGDLESARHEAINGRWSIRCEGPGVPHHRTYPAGRATAMGAGLRRSDPRRCVRADPRGHRDADAAVRRRPAAGASRERPAAVSRPCGDMRCPQVRIVNHTHQETAMTIEELALKIAKEQGSDALDDWAGLGEMLAEHGLGDHATEDLAELVRKIHTRAWELYANAITYEPRVGDPGE